jgi:dienelactone hydrolase
VPLTTRTVAYADHGIPLTGELYSEVGDVPRPGILLIHGGAGLDDHARGQASRHAALGYVVFACDMLGDGVAGDRERVIGSLTAMRDDPGLLARRARAGLAAAVSIHGSLVTSRPAGPDAVRARVLVCHGDLDPHVPMADVAGCAGEMDRAGADWQLIIYGGAMHGFTHQHAVPGAVPGVAYHRLADERSFAATRAFLAEALT